MAQTDMLRQYLDAGIAFTQMTRARAEEIVKELVKAGEVQREQVQTQVDDLVERSRRNTDQLLTMVRNEVSSQFSQLGLATRDELLQKLWGRRESHRDRTVDVFVRRLREKIDRPASSHTFIQTRYGVGYKLEPVPKDSG